jgi:hypothetical protein
MNVMKKLTATIIAFPMCVLLLAGCGGESGPATYSVSGTVTFDGEPVPDGQIAFRDPAGEIASAGGKIENGQFSVQALPGRMQVEITARRETGEFDESNPDERVPILEQYIPEKYNTETELVEEIQPETNEFHFELTSN